MRVTLVSRLAGIHRGGGEVYDLSLAAALRSTGADVDVVTGRPLLGPAPSPVAEAPARYVRSPYLRGAAHRLGRAGWRLFDLDLRAFERGAFGLVASSRPRPDIVQVTGLPDLARRIESDLGVPAVLLFPGPPSTRHRETIAACRNVVGVGAVTPYLRERFRPDVHDMTAGVDVERFRPGVPDVRGSLGIPAAAPVILYAGRLVPLKNLPLLVEAFAEIRRALPEARLVVAGDGPLRSYIFAAAARHGLSASPGPSPAAALVHAGEIPHAEMPARYASADLVVLTSLEESFSLVALEAMACGRALLVPAVGYLPRLVEDGATGALYPAGDRAALVGRALALLADGGARRRLGAAARERALARHSWAAVAAEFLALYRRILGG
jgi:glycosyltransferase involved in cell wall biosynthesis